ncbi:MAG: endo-1,4-beta-xylanase [Abitibacteriaceae bacterium]|nr:endo-1,4-beta-xylanase [Abditibacteriaceae bacterium]
MLWGLSGVAYAQQNAGTGNAGAGNATAQLPDLKPDAIVHPLYRSVVAEVQNLHPKLLLLNTDPDAALEKFQRNSVSGRANFSLVPVVGMPFKGAMHIDTERKPQEWMTHIQSFTKEPIHNGDVLYVTAWVRALRITNGKSEGEGRLYASGERGGNQHDSSGLGVADFAIPQQWTRIHIPLRAERDFTDDDQMKLMFTFGQTSQVVEFGGLTVLDFGPGVSKENLPHAKLPLDYPGRQLNSAWRKAAAERIEKYRKGNLTVVVTDAAGKPVKNADVKVNMTRHAFLFGASTPTGMLPGQDVKPWNADFARTAGASAEDKKKLQEVFLKHFNSTTASVTWTIWNGGDARISRDDIIAGLKWFKDNNIPVLNSQVVYPSPEFTPSDIVKNLMNKEHAGEFGKAVDAFIVEQVRPNGPLGPYLASVEIANEIEGRLQYTDILGRDAVAHWFKVAQQANPAMGREITGPYSLGAGTVQTENRGAQWPTQSEGLQYYYDLIAYLLKQGAPIQYIAFQNHGGLGMPGPEAVLKSLDQFSTFKLPLEVTEFEVALQNGSDAEQRQYQADYVRDYFTAVFSHPSVRAIILQDFWQPGAWQYEGASAFFNKDWSINLHGKAYEDLVLNQ